MQQLTLKVSPSLAAEIGLSPSIVLLQIEFWLSREGTFDDGHVWVKRTVSDFDRTFKFLSRKQIKNILVDLCNSNLLIVKNFHWYALNYEGCQKLKGWKFYSPKLEIISDGSPLNNPPSLCIIQESKDAYTHGSASGEEGTDEDWDNWAFGAETGQEKQLSLLPSGSLRKKKDFRADPVSSIQVQTLCRICYGIDPAVFDKAPERLKGQTAKAISDLQNMGADLGRLNIFETWWKKNWRSRDKESKQYQYPRPDQVIEHWWMSMHEPVPKDDAKQVVEQINVYDFMRRRAELKHKK